MSNHPLAQVGAALRALCTSQARQWPLLAILQSLMPWEHHLHHIVWEHPQMGCNGLFRSPCIGPVVALTRDAWSVLLLPENPVAADEATHPMHLEVVVHGPTEAPCCPLSSRKPSPENSQRRASAPRGHNPRTGMNTTTTDSANVTTAGSLSSRLARFLFTFRLGAWFLSFGRKTIRQSKNPTTCIASQSDSQIRPGISNPIPEHDPPYRTLFRLSDCLPHSRCSSSQSSNPFRARLV